MLADITVVASDSALAEEAAQAVASAAEEAVSRTGRFTLALSGGRTPERLYVRLASEPFSSRIDWGRVHVFWGDERCVPPDHPSSNYRLAYESLLSKVPVAAERVHRMRGEDSDPERAAEDYARELRRVFDLAPAAIPRFDLILLGLGSDGHTASLFPGSSALNETTRLAVAVYAESVQAYRLTVTLPVLNGAARVIFVVAGDEKAEALKRALTGGASPSWPASLVRPERSPLWLVERSAATWLGAIAG